MKKKTASEVAQRFGYTYRGFTTIVSNFRKELKKGNYKQLYFKELKHGRKEVGQKGKDIIISLRKKYYSVEDIKIALDSKGFNISEKSIYNIIRGQGFARLPRRQKLTKKSLEPISIKADKTVALSFVPESFKSASAGILCLLPYIKKYGISDLIQSSCFPETTQVSKLSSYSHRVTKEMNFNFPKALHANWQALGLLGDTSNLGPNYLREVPG